MQRNKIKTNYFEKNIRKVFELSVLLMLFSCTTLQNEVHVNKKEQLEQEVITSLPILPITPNQDVITKSITESSPVSIVHGRLVKFISTNDILFDFDSFKLKKESFRILDDLAKELQYLQNKIKVIGYADRIGLESYNRKLSLRRAESVKIYFISKGIDPDQISTYGCGEENSITGVNYKEHLEREALINCLAPDRRVEIEVIW